MKKLIILLLALTLLLSACSSAGTVSETGSSAASSEAQSSEPSSEEPSSEEPSSEEPSSEEPSEESSDIVETTAGIVVFGDSIAYGATLDNRENDAFPFVITNKLNSAAADGVSFICYNYAVNGYKSSDMEEEITGAGSLGSDTGAVLISIGANNLLGPAITAFMTAVTAAGGDAMTSVQNFVAGNRDDATVAAVSSLINGVAAAFTNETFTSAAAAGIAQLAADLPVFIAQIKAAAPGAVIYYQTIYNPYKGVSFAASEDAAFDMGAMSDGYIKQLNEIITSNADALGYKVVDVYSAFETSDERLVNVNFTGDGELNYDPHPNVAGHLVITGAYIAAMAN